MKAKTETTGIIKKTEGGYTEGERHSKEKRKTKIGYKECNADGQITKEIIERERRETQFVCINTDVTQMHLDE